MSFNRCSRVILTLFIAVGFVFTTACSSTSTTKSDSSTSTQTAVDMNGYVFTIASPWMRDKAPDDAMVMEKLFQKSRAQVESEYNCKIKIANFYPDLEALQPKIMAGDKIADIIEFDPELMYPAASAGYLIPWDDVEGIDVNDPDWVKFSTTIGTYNGKHYGLEFKQPAEVRSCIFFNKDLLLSSGVTEDPYELVREGKWTFDKFAEIAKACTRDTNGDGSYDTYGVTCINPLLVGNAFISANNGAMASLVDGKVTCTYDSQESVTALNFYNKLVNEDHSFKVYDYMKSESTWNNPLTDDEVVNDFLSGDVAFLVHESWLGNQKIKPNAGDLNYGLLPLPMGPDAKDYVSPSQTAEIFCMCVNNTDYSKSVTIMNALKEPVSGYEGTDWVDEDIQNEYFQDDDTDSIEMYNLCLSKAMVDIGYGIGTARSTFDISAIANGIFFKTCTPSAGIASISKAALQEKYDAVFNKNN